MTEPRRAVRVRVLAVLACAARRGRLHAALAGRAELRFAACWREARRHAAGRRPHLVVFDPAADGAWCGGHEGFRDAFSNVLLVAYAPFREHAPRSVLYLAGTGVREVIDEGVDDTPETILELVERLVHGAPPPALAALFARCPPELRRWLGELYRGDAALADPAAAARRFGRHPKTLRDHLRRAGLPPLARLLTWLRLLRVAEALEGGAGSAERVALRLGFASGASLGNSMKRYTGLTPSQLRRGGGAAAVVAALEREIAQGRGGRGAQSRSSE